MTIAIDQAELDRCREIIFAAIDYEVEKQGSSLTPQQVKYYTDFNRIWKEQVDKQYQAGELEKLRKSLLDKTIVYKITGDLGFVQYVKEKTGYEFDLFGNIEKRIGKILLRGHIANTKERNDVSTALELSRKTGVGQQNTPALRNMLASFESAHRKVS